jgi:hypothetical protein
VIAREVDPVTTELAVIAISSQRIVYRTKVPTAGLIAADWVELP